MTCFSGLSSYSRKWKERGKTKAALMSRRQNRYCKREKTLDFSSLSLGTVPPLLCVSPLIYFHDSEFPKSHVDELEIHNRLPLSVHQPFSLCDMMMSL